MRLLEALAIPRSRTGILFLVAALLSACEGGGSASAARSGANGPVTLTLGAYTTPREVYRRIVPAFQESYRARAGSPVELRESYLASGAQARAIVAGFEADIAALSLEPDIEKLEEARLVTHDWAAGAHRGIVSRSIVVIGVRAGNPKNIRDWADLARPGMEVLTPNVRTSGGAMWNVAAVYGAALRGHAGVPAGDSAAAVDLLAGILRNVKTMDRSGRDSMLTFERGVGDAIVTYENEILVGRMNGQRYEYVVPPGTVSIENPVAIVDAYVDRHRTRDAARAFVDFLFGPEAQRAFAEGGYRPVLPEVAEESRGRFPAPEHLFTVADMGGWKALHRDVFAEGAAYDRALARSRGEGGR